MSLVAAYVVPHPPLAIPEVGRGEERGIARTIAGYEEVARRIAEIAPEVILITSPHSAYYRDWVYLAAGAGAAGDMAQFRAPEVRFALSYDEGLRDRIAECAREAGVPAGCVEARSRAIDHGMGVPLYFLEREYPHTRYQAVSIGGSALPREQLLAFGRCLAQAAEEDGRTCALVASGDLSHKLLAEGPYGFDPAGPRFDEAFCEVVRAGDPLAFAQLDERMCEDSAECGLSGFIMMAGALDEAARRSGCAFSSELISHEGPFGVGYGVAAFERSDARVSCGAGDAASERDATREGNGTADAAGVAGERPAPDPLVALARQTVEQYVRTRTVPVPSALPADLPARAGCFVSIHVASTNDLRGCIGTIEPVRASLAEEVISNAVSAATRDPRFPPIAPDELDDLTISVDVLFAPEPARIEDLDVRRCGVVVTQGFRRGLLLPDLEGVDTVEDQLRIACAKAGIDWRRGFDGIEIERFEVVRHE